MGVSDTEASAVSRVPRDLLQLVCCQVQFALSLSHKARRQDGRRASRVGIPYPPVS